MKRQIALCQMDGFRAHLRREERSPGTVEKYLRDARRFIRWLGRRPVTKALAAGWKQWLLERGYAPATVNSMLAAVNSLFAYLGWEDCRMRYLKVQRRLFRDQRWELTRADYGRLLKTARARGQGRLALLVEAICSTGIRVSEVRYLTVEAARLGRAEVALKGKIRTILLTPKLCRKLLHYARRAQIASGEIFLTRSGRRLGRRQIWAQLKQLGRDAGVEPGKVFPHNLRHLFAVVFYRAYKDISKLADVLGHSSLETTRIYLASSGNEHARLLERLDLIE